MSGRTADIAIIGGGLAGGLTALAISRAHPEVTLRLVEAGASLGGNHRWSWFASDLSPAGEMLMAGFRKAVWDEGYHVRFPAYRRRLHTPYRSLASADFAARLERELPAGSILTNREVVSLDAEGASLSDGTRITARAVIDCRGFAPTDKLRGGWQVFMGRQLRTPQPHGLARPIIMDAAVDQLGGYRFVYTLPLGAHDLFIEDTYYQDRPQLDRSALSARIDDYQARMGWTGEPVAFETGVLPVITGGNFRNWQREVEVPGVTLAGTRGGFVHPLTSYSLPSAVATALAIAEDADLPGDQLSAKIAARARQHWASMGYYRFLGKMLFGAARPDQRYKVFERFYRLREPLIERFYAGNSSMADKARVLLGKPPVPIMRALGALASSSSPLKANPQ